MIYLEGSFYFYSGNIAHFGKKKKKKIIKINGVKTILLGIL